MKNRTRKFRWPMLLVSAMVVAAAVALVAAFGGSSTPVQAQSACDNIADPIERLLCLANEASGVTPTPTMAPGGTTTPTTPSGDGMHHTGHVEVPSDSPSKDEDIFVTVDELLMNLPSGSSIVVFLRDEWSVPESIPASAVYFVVESPTSTETGSGARVRAVDSVKIDGDTYFSDDSNDDSSIRVFIPDMCPSQVGAGSDCVGFNGPVMGQKLTMVIEGESGIRSPSEAGRYDAGFQVLGPLGSVTSTTVALELGSIGP